MANGHGGKRAGAGAKPGAYTQLKRLMQAQIIDEAHKSIDFYVRVRDDESVSMAVRLAAAVRLEERAFGKAVQPLSERQVEDWRAEATAAGYDAEQFVREAERIARKRDRAHGTLAVAGRARAAAQAGTREPA